MWLLCISQYCGSITFMLGNFFLATFSLNVRGSNWFKNSCATELSLMVLGTRMTCLQTVVMGNDRRLYSGLSGNWTATPSQLPGCLVSWPGVLTWNIASQETWGCLTYFPLQSQRNFVALKTNCLSNHSPIVVISETLPSLRAWETNSWAPLKHSSEKKGNASS